MAKHIWSKEENIICCLSCVSEYVIKKNGCDPFEFIEKLHSIFIAIGSDIPFSSIRMKMQNIKQLFIELDVENNLRINELEHYSKDNKEAMISVLDMLSIEYNK